MLRWALTRTWIGTLLCFAAMGCGSTTTPNDGGDVIQPGDTAGDGVSPMDVDPGDAAGDVIAPMDVPVGDTPTMDVNVSDIGVPDVPPPDGGPMCGNGTVDMGEQCDTGARRSDSVPGACRTNCRNASCGDNVVDYPAEQCDDGNATAGDGCDAMCQRERPPTCGDGRLDLATGEQCDDANTMAGDGCSPTCQFELVGGMACGNNRRDGREVCDDGNTNNGDACNPTCNLANAVTTYAGTGMAGFRDGPIAMAQFMGTAVLTADATHLWIGDAGNRRLRRIDVTAMAPMVTTVAGDGTMGFRDGPGAMAQFGAFESIATDGTTVWVGDSPNRRIRAVSTVAPHMVTTLSGTGAMGCADGPASMAQFQDIRGLTYYAGNLYYVDAVCATLRRIDPRSGSVITLAGTAMMTGRVNGYGAAARFISPRYIASDNSGMLYISDTNGNQIRSYNTRTGLVGTFAGSGTVGYTDGIGTMAQVHRPRGMTSDGTSLYFVEFEQQTVRQGVLATQSVTTLAGRHCMGMAMCAGGNTNGTGTAARFNAPWSVAFHYPSNSLFVMDSGNSVLRRIR